MPETTFTIRWPDGATEACYSPSSTVSEFFTPGQSYPLPQFLDLSRQALDRASDRVKAKYGFACANAAAQLERIEARARHYPDPQAHVTCLSIT